MTRKRKRHVYRDGAVYSPLMREFLQQVVTARQRSGYIFPKRDWNTVRALVRRGVIQVVARPDGDYRCVATHYGRRIHATQLTNRYRNDGMCPRCGERERHGAHGYCLPCRRVYQRQRYEEVGRQRYKQAGYARVNAELGGGDV